MGKQRRPRRKLHLSNNKPNTKSQNQNHDFDTTPNSSFTSISPINNIFAGINIDVNNLKKNLSDDTRSMKSFKSLKSETSDKVLPKKDKVKLRRQLLLQKIDTVNQIKRESSNKRFGKTKKINLFRDELPSLITSVNALSSDNCSSKSVSVKGIANAKTRKKKYVEDVQILKKLIAEK